MPSITRLVSGAIVLLLLPVFACEVVPVPADPTSVDMTPDDPSPSPPPAPPPAPDVAAAATPGDTDTGVTYASASSPANPMTPGSTPATPADPITPGSTPATPAVSPTVAAFAAGGEERLECPVGYHAQTAEGGCACVSSSDHISVAAFTEAPCSTAGRAEGDECIFVCGAQRS